LPEIAFYSLQIGSPAGDLDGLGEFRTAVRDLRDVQRDLADAAAIIRQMDLVITVDTSLLHLAAGLGIPVWGLISRRSDWRWLDNDRTVSPWYPTLRLFRQKELNDWPELMCRVADQLSRLGR
jgi:ADP-heptose:LPS heptosyltransferase